MIAIPKKTFFIMMTFPPRARPLPLLPPRPPPLSSRPPLPRPLPPPLSLFSFLLGGEDGDGDGSGGGGDVRDD